MFIPCICCHSSWCYISTYRDEEDFPAWRVRKFIWWGRYIFRSCSCFLIYPISSNRSQLTMCHESGHLVAGYAPVASH